MNSITSKERFLDKRKWIDLAIVAFCFSFSAALNKGIDENFLSNLLFNILAFGICLNYSKSYDTFWRFTSFHDITSLTPYILAANIMSFTGVLAGELNFLVFMNSALLSGFMLTGIRTLRRFTFERTNKVSIKRNGKKTLIYGAGQNGSLLAQRFLKDPEQNLFPVGFVDDQKRRHGKVVMGLEILGGIDEIEEIITRFSITEFIISIDNLDGNKLQKVLKVCHKKRIRPKLLSGIGLDSWDSKNYELFKDVNIEDLLNRKRVDVDKSAIKEIVNDKSVLVTGAGGSIGSELCRQICSMEPSEIVIIDHSEYNLYAIHKELEDHYPHLKGSIHPVLLDIVDKKSLGEVFAKYELDLVYHAAAYKHVHLVEVNPYFGISNNIIGTRNLLELTEESNVERFLLISSDKAVNPTNIMGSTKRICELLVTTMAKKSKKIYCSVRFGNVLGSSGSFIPLLKKQVRQGGPVTITDKRMKRYFMLIPEAVSLVLEASRISTTGDINVLKMGKPIKIVDIAKKMITLMGKSEKEVPIIYTGIRPGEKLYEELYLCGDEVNTNHKDIVVLPKGDAFNNDVSPIELYEKIQLMCNYAKDSNPKAVEILRELVNTHKRKDKVQKAG